MLSLSANKMLTYGAQLKVNADGHAPTTHRSPEPTLISLIFLIMMMLIMMIIMVMMVKIRKIRMIRKIRKIRKIREIRWPLPWLTE